MKTVISILILTFCMTSCKKVDAEVKGCTDSNAVNYNASANKDDGSCTYNYSTSLSFWQDFASSQSLTAANSSSLVKFYIDGIEVGAMTNDIYSATEPPCGNGGYVKSVGLGSAQTGMVQYEVRYFDGTSWLVFQNGNVSVIANDCTSIQIVF